MRLGRLLRLVVGILLLLSSIVGLVQWYGSEDNEEVTISTSEPASGQSVAPQPAATTPVVTAPATASAVPPVTEQPAQLPAIAPAEMQSLQILRDSKVLFGAKGAPTPMVATQNKHCKTPLPCYNPPRGLVARVADAGAFEWPSTNTVLMGAHSNRHDPSNMDTWPFSRLPEVQMGDTEVIKTSNATYTYVVQKSYSLSYAAFPTAELKEIVPNRLVLFTCEISDDLSGYVGVRVVEAMLISVQPA